MNYKLFANGNFKGLYMDKEIFEIQGHLINNSGEYLLGDALYPVEKTKIIVKPLDELGVGEVNAILQNVKGLHTQSCEIVTRCELTLEFLLEHGFYIEVKGKTITHEQVTKILKNNE